MPPNPWPIKRNRTFEARDAVLFGDFGQLRALRAEGLLREVGLPRLLEWAEAARREDVEQWLRQSFEEGGGSGHD